MSYKELSEVLKREIDERKFEEIIDKFPNYLKLCKFKKEYNVMSNIMTITNIIGSSKTIIGNIIDINQLNSIARDIALKDFCIQNGVYADIELW